MKKIFILIIAILTLLSASNKFKKLIITNNKTELMVAYPKAVEENGIATIGLYMKNRNEFAKLGGATISFPQLRKTKIIFQKDTFKDISTYIVGDKLYSGIYRNNITARYPAIELWENDWKKNESKKAFISIRVPTGLKELAINVRGITIEGKGKKRVESLLPKNSFSQDQQGYDIKTIYIPILKAGSIPKGSHIDGGTKKPNKQEKHSQGATGTGFYVNKNTVLTNNHVVKGCRKLTILQVGFKSKAEVITTDKNNDLAIIRSEKENSNILKFKDSKNSRIGEKVISMGYPYGNLLGNNIKLTTGILSSLNGMNNDITKIQFTAPIQSGNSGGPVLNDRAQVIAIAYAKVTLKYTQNVNLGIKGSVAKMFLNANDIEFTVDRNETKMEIVDIADKTKKGIVQIECLY